ncbi:MAG: IPT/TIG domain-containing protein [Peptococcaceae bacterium]|jgi:hypothetical protein|nr:IPT/TIG domain-containing protein [Peptococcaceae bacterium]
MVRFVEPSGKTALTISCQAGGHFTTPNLPTKSHNPSVYQLVATAPGYGTFIMQSVPLFDRQIVTVALPLPPAGQTVTGPGFSLLPGPGSGLGALMPVVAGIFPASGPVTGGTRVILTGTNFFRGGRGQLPTVDFGTHAATSVTLLSANRIQATSPAGSGTVNVTVTTMIGTSVTGSADRFTYVGEPIP